MFDGKPFFIMPIYRCSSDDYYTELEEKREKLKDYFNSSLPINLRNTYDVNPLVEKSLNWKCWQYNETIGFIELYILGEQIRGTLYIVDKKKIRKDIKDKKMVESGKLFELSTHNFKSNEIFNLLMEELKRIQSEDLRLKNRYIDFSGILKIGSYVDWKELVKNNR